MVGAGAADRQAGDGRHPGHHRQRVRHHHHRPRQSNVDRRRLQVRFGLSIIAVGKGEMETERWRQTAAPAAPDRPADNCPTSKRNSASVNIYWDKIHHLFSLTPHVMAKLGLRLLPNGRWPVVYACVRTCHDAWEP